MTRRAWLLTALGGFTTSLSRAADPAPVSLRQLATARGLHFGAATAVGPLRDEPLYGEVLAREYNCLVPENAMKFGPLCRARGVYRFDDAQLLADFAQKHKMMMRGHTLIWHQQQPDWLVKGKFTRDEMRAILKEHVTTVVKQFRGRIAQWDVVNEAIADKTFDLRKTVWSEGVGPDYIERAFRTAHDADPGVKLFYNDYGAEGLGGKSDAVFKLVSDLKRKNVPLHGLGLQMHFDINKLPNLDDIGRNMDRLRALGLEIAVTELDVRLKVPPTPELLQRQADAYRDLLALCLEHKRCSTFLTWGFTDKHSWIPNFSKGNGAALPFDETYAPKPAVAALAEAMKR